MAEPVIVPVQLEVTDIDMSNINFGDVQKQISKNMSGIKKAVSDAFSGIDESAISKPIESAMASVKKSVQAAEEAQLRYNEAVMRAAKSNPEYGEAVKAIDSEINALEKVAAQWSDKSGNIPGIIQAAIQPKMNALLQKRAQLNPLEFLNDKVPATQLERVAQAYKKLLTAQESVNQKSDKFNQTIQDNKLTEEYQDYLKQAEAYKKKLDELEEKSKRMGDLGATDKQWETLRYDVEQTAAAMTELNKKMRDAVKEGRALRFGDGDTSKLNYESDIMAMLGRSKADRITRRAMSNENPYTAEYQKALEELDKVEKQIENIREKSAKMIELGASQKQFQNLAYDAESLDVKVDEIKNHLMNMVEEGSAFKFSTGDADAEIQRVRDKSGALQSTLTGVANTARKAQGGLTALGATHPRLAAILDVASKIAVGFGKVLKVAGKVATVLAKGFVGAVKVLGRVASAVGRIASNFASLGKRIMTGIRNMSLFGKSGRKTSGDLDKRFKKLTKNILMWGFGFRTAYYAIKRLRTIFMDGFKAMGEQFDAVGQPMTQMMESFNRLKGSLATAFQPLVSVVMPILTRFMNYLSALLENFGKFTATLTGQGHIYKAVAKDIDSVSNSAKEANKQLGSYDKLDVIQKNDAGYEYEQQDIASTENAASNFAQMVKEAWENADFTSVGEFVSNKLLEVLDKVETTFAPKAVEFVNKVLRSINTFVDGFDFTAVGNKLGSIVNVIISSLDWTELGTTFANILNITWEFVDGLVNQINWSMLGDKIAEGIDAMSNALNFDAMVNRTTGFVNGIAETLYSIFTKVNWAELSINLGNALNNLFAGLDTARIGQTINALFTTLWTIIGNFFATVDFELIAQKLADGINNIFSGNSSAFQNAIPNIASGLVTFFVTAISQINWSGIANILFNSMQALLTSVGSAMSESNNPLVSAFGSVVTSISQAFDALKPAVEAVIQAFVPIIQSILPVISTMLPPIASLISQVATMVLPVLTNLFTALMPVLSNLIASILPVLMNLLVSLQPLFDALIYTVLPFIVNLLDVCMPLIQGILSLVSNLLAPILALLGPLMEIVVYILDPIIKLLEPIISVLGTLCELIGNILRPILDMLLPILEAVSAVFQILGPFIGAMVAPINLLADVFQFIAGVVTAVLLPVLEFLSTSLEAVMNVAKSLANAFTIAFGAIEVAFNAVRDLFANVANSIIGVIESLANGVIRGLNGMIRAMNKLSFEVPDWVPSIGGETFGFNIKEISTISIPRLAQGAVIPPNKEFLAVLGDQKRGTNIEAPLDTIKQAVAEVLAEMGGGGTREPIILQVNGRTLAKVVWDEQEKRYKQTGKAMA